jgi:hypothetical protein
VPNATARAVSAVGTMVQRPPSDASRRPRRITGRSRAQRR